MSDNSCSNNLFNSGFTELSFFNLHKKATEGIYKKYSQISIKSHKKYDFKFLYYDSKSFNASVDHKDNTDYLYINVGTVGTIYATFYSLFSSPKFFPNIGDIDKELLARKIDFVFNSDKKQLGYTGIPICSVRRRVAEYVSLLALIFIASHELGHIFNGHAEYMNKKLGLATLSMYNEGRLDNFSSLDYKTIEMDADAAAMTRSIDNILSIYEDFDKYDLKRLIGNKEVLLKLWSVSIFSLFLVLEDNYPSGVNWTHNKYLPNLVRYFVNLDAAMQYVKTYMKISKYRYDDDFYDYLYSIIVYSIREVEKNYNEIFKTKHNLYQYIDTNAEAINKHSQIVLDNWKKIRPDLEEYSRVELYGENMKFILS